MKVRVWSFSQTAGLVPLFFFNENKDIFAIGYLDFERTD